MLLRLLSKEALEVFSDGNTPLPCKGRYSENTILLTHFAKCSEALKFVKS